VNCDTGVHCVARREAEEKVEEQNGKGGAHSDVGEGGVAANQGFKIKSGVDNQIRGLISAACTDFCYSFTRRVPRKAVDDKND